MISDTADKFHFQLSNAYCSICGIIYHKNVLQCRHIPELFLKEGDEIGDFLVLFLQMWISVSDLVTVKNTEHRLLHIAGYVNIGLIAKISSFCPVHGTYTWLLIIARNTWEKSKHLYFTGVFRSTCRLEENGWYI